MTAFEAARSVADAYRAALKAAAADDEGPTAADIAELRDELAADLRAVTAEWPDRPHGPLRVTKARMRATAQCAAQVLGEVEPYALDSSLAVGRVCDLAAGVVAVHPGFSPTDSWYEALLSALMQEHPDVVDLVANMRPDDREMLRVDIDRRCAELPGLLGDLNTQRITVRERIAVEFAESNVLLAAEIDLTVGGGRRLLVEVKSGSFGSSVPDELRHYGLLGALRDGVAPLGGCAVTLNDGAVTSIPLRLVDLRTAARRLVTTAERLVQIDRYLASGQPVPTSPGGHCRWCRRVRSCADVDERVLAELPAVYRSVSDDDIRAELS